MQQLTEQQAIQFAESKEWETWTSQQIVDFQLFQGRLCLDFSRFHQAMEEVLGRPLWTHEFAERGGLIAEYMGKRPAPSFEDIIGLIPEDKRLMIGL